MSTLLPDQKVHDLAVAFAVAEYNNEVKRRQVELEAAQQGIPIFLFLYEQAFEDFKRTKHYCSDV